MHRVQVHLLTYLLNVASDETHAVDFAGSIVDSLPQRLKKGQQVVVGRGSNGSTILDGSRNRLSHDKISPYHFEIPVQ